MTLKRIAGLFLLALVALTAFYAIEARAATLLPPGKQTFLDANGAPLSGGTVTFYVPGTTTPKDTYQDAAGTVLNANPVVLNGSGQAVIFGSGAYRQILRDGLGNQIWDQITADTASSASSWSGTSGGTANAMTVSAANFTSAAGQMISFIAGTTNTAAASINVNGSGAINILKDQSTGAVSLTGGEIVAGNIVQLVYDATVGAFHIVNPTGSSAAFASLAAATTTNLGTITSRKVTITGTATISSFGSSASTSNPIYDVRYPAGATLTYNATSMILPGANDIVTQANDYSQAVYLGSGNWQVVNYQRASYLAGAIPGELRTFAMQTCPSGWLAASGGTQSRAAYPTLFAALGTTWGAGDGSTTFGLPDTRGNFLRGWDNGAGVDSARAFASLQTDAFKAHVHTFVAYNTGGATASASAAASGSPGPQYQGTTDSTGGTETRPRNIAVQYCLKT